MRIGLLGGLSVEHDGQQVGVTGTMQLAVLFRLAVDAGSSVSYRAIAEDVWSDDPPENAKAALQSIVSRLRSQLPTGVIESTAGGYRLNVRREDVDALLFSDRVALAQAADDADERQRIASDALGLWSGEPWVPSEDFDWFERDLRRDRATALKLGGSQAALAPSTTEREPSIPVALTELVGRERELESIGAQLAASRLVTIVGSGGAGKTRLALETAAGIRGSILVELAPVGPDELFAAVLAATGRELRTTEGVTEAVSGRERVLEALVGRSALLVLDNCEHVIAAAATVAEDLLGALPQLRILATSREPLGVPGEAFVSVGPLPHPDDTEISESSARSLRDFDAVELFAQRAFAARGRELDDDELLVSARICARLDGLPLALELAAAKLRTMTPDEVLAGLEDRFALLTGGFRTVLPRHQTLRAMIDWSWSLLGEDERVALSRIAAFPAGIDAAEATEFAREIGLSSVATFDALVDRSLLQRSRGRFRALETIREYGIERLSESGELAMVRELQARFMLSRAVRNDRRIRGPEIREAIAWFDAEDDNLVAALRYASRAHLGDELVGIVVACAWYWILRDRQEESRSWFEAAAAVAMDVDTDEARMLAVIAPLASALGGNDMDEEHGFPETIGTMLDLAFPRLGPDSHEVFQLIEPLFTAFANAAKEGEGWWLRTVPPTGEGLDLGPWPSAVLHVMRAAFAQNSGDIEELGVHAERAIEAFLEQGDLWGLAIAEQMRAEWLVLTGKLDEGYQMTEASTEHMRSITPSWDLAQQQGLAISILLRQGRIEDARRRVAGLITEAENSGNSRTILQTNLTALSAAVVTKDWASAAAHLAAYDTLVGSWPGGNPRQLAAMAENARAAILLASGDREAAERALRSSVDAALASHDHPIIGAVALGVGMFALDRGDIPEALRALDLATAIIGIYDSTAPQVIAIEAAARAAGIERAGAEAPTRSGALEALKAFS